MTTIFSLAFALVVTLQTQPLVTGTDDVRSLTLSRPVTTRTLSGAEFRGRPTQMCPSPDGSQLYVRLSERDRWGNETSRQVLLTPWGGEVLPLQGEPAWVASCWLEKSSPHSPALPAFRMEVEGRYEQVRSTNVPREGSIGMSTADPTAGLDEVAKSAAFSQQKTYFETLTAHGKVIATSINQHVAPGESFGWSPTPRALLAFVGEKGRLMLMDPSGRTRTVAGTSRVLLPVWSADGSRLLFLERKGSGKYDLREVTVTGAQ